MTDREKLYELIDSVDIMNMPTENFSHSLADYLLSNGVVVRDKGEWYGSGDGYADGELVYDMWECGCCGHDTYTDEKPEWFFCPWCGADMRKEKENE